MRFLHLHPTIRTLYDTAGVEYVRQMHEALDDACLGIDYCSKENRFTVFGDELTADKLKVILSVLDSSTFVYKILNRYQYDDGMVITFRIEYVMEFLSLEGDGSEASPIMRSGIRLQRLITQFGFSFH